MEDCSTLLTIKTLTEHFKMHYHVSLLKIPVKNLRVAFLTNVRKDPNVTVG
jgi:hypothetical protein